jgi:hypothetical protein
MMGARWVINLVVAERVIRRGKSELARPRDVSIPEAQAAV